ncbi:MAG: SGNH/GDSL hydrolase family protein, partial [Lysobacterales bacterium]
GRVLVVSIPDWGVTAFAANDARGAAAIGSAIDAFNAVARDEARRKGIVFIDITGVSRAPEQSAQLVDDGLHPSFAQYRAWTDRVAPAALAALESPR